MSGPCLKWPNGFHCTQKKIHASKIWKALQSVAFTFFCRLTVPSDPLCSSDSSLFSVVSTQMLYCLRAFASAIPFPGTPFPPLYLTQHFLN